MPYCNNCGGHVTAKYVRCFGFDGEIEACHSCETNRAVNEGAGLPAGMRDTR